MCELSITLLWKLPECTGVINTTQASELHGSARADAALAPPLTPKWRLTVKERVLTPNISSELSLLLCGKWLHSVGDWNEPDWSRVIITRRAVAHTTGNYFRQRVLYLNCAPMEVFIALISTEFTPCYVHFVQLCLQWIISALTARGITGAHQTFSKIKEDKLQGCPEDPAGFKGTPVKGHIHLSCFLFSFNSLTMKVWICEEL